MGFRFRKSVSLFPGVRLNIGKKGLGISAGVKGARVGVGSKGAYTSVGIPGTGISSVSYIGKGKRHSQAGVPSTPKGTALMGFLFLAAIVVTFIQPVVGLLLIFALLLIGYMRNRKAKQAEMDAET